MVYLDYYNNFSKFDHEFHQDLDFYWDQYYLVEKKFSPLKNRVYEDFHLRDQYLYYKDWIQKTGHKRIH